MDSSSFVLQEEQHQKTTGNTTLFRTGPIPKISKFQKLVPDKHFRIRYVLAPHVGLQYTSISRAFVGDTSQRILTESMTFQIDWRESHATSKQQSLVNMPL